MANVAESMLKYDFHAYKSTSYQKGHLTGYRKDQIFSNKVLLLWLSLAPHVLYAQGLSCPAGTLLLRNAIFRFEKAPAGTLLLRNAAIVHISSEVLKSTPSKVHAGLRYLEPHPCVVLVDLVLRREYITQTRHTHIGDPPTLSASSVLDIPPASYTIQ